MARTVKSALDVQSKLRELRAQVASLEIDTATILNAIDEADLREETLAGGVVFPEGAEQSDIILYNNNNLAFSKRSGRFFAVVAKDPETLLIETVPPPPPPPPPPTEPPAEGGGGEGSV